MMKIIHSDVTVVGGGIAGICAAVAAARKGLSVALINDRSVLGGNTSSEIGVGICGASHGGKNPSIYAKEGGIIEELRLRFKKYNAGGGYGQKALTDAVLFDFIYEHPTINLMLNTLVYGCNLDNRKIECCHARHNISNVDYEFKSKTFIDASGNGVLAHEAGCEYRMGREGKNDFDEFWAPDVTDQYTMGNTIYMETEDIGKEVLFTPPKFAYDIANMDFVKDIDKPENFRGFSIHGSHWAFEFGGQLNTIYDSEDVDLELRKLVFGIWDYVKNSGKYPKAKTYILKRVFAKSGSRESRRFIGDYVLNENDIENKVKFEDSVCIGGWPMDVHAPLGIYDSLPASNFIPVTSIYNIPMRCLYSKDIDNLFFAGRDISATHIALGSTRVMATCGVIGQAVGTAAYFCHKYDLSPRHIAKFHIKEVQQELLDDDQTIVGLNDIGGGMHNFTAAATSELNFENINSDGLMKMERDYCLALMLESDRIESIKFKIKNNSVNPAKLKIKILTGKYMETFLPDEIVGSREVNVKGNFDDWLDIVIDANKGKDSKIYIVLEKNDSLEIYISETRLIGAITMRMHTVNNCAGRNHDSVPLNERTGYQAFDHVYEAKRNVLFKDIVPKQRVYAPNMAVNAYSRPYGIPNLWIPSGEFPQTLTLTTEKPIDAENIGIIFDTELDNDDKKEMPDCLVRDYEIRIATEEGEGIIHKSFFDNDKRFARHPVNAKNISKIEIKINSSWGKTAGIYGVKLL